MSSYNHSSSEQPMRVVHPSGAPHPFGVSHTESRPEVIARLEWLDDLMFAAIDGDPVALEAAVHAWRRTVEELGPKVVVESRRQYMRRAQSVWNSLRNDPSHPPQKSFAAIEIISLLTVRSW
jgi:hypothetical protein